jgi:hypothetical protein
VRRLASLGALVPARRVRLAALVTVLLLPIYWIASYSFAITRDPSAVDYSYFGPAGADILTGRFNEVYALAAVQAGPFELLCYGPAYLLGVLGFTGWLAYYVVLLTVLSFGVVLLVLVVIGDAPRRRLFWVALGTVAAANLGWFLPLAVLSGHPAQIVIPLFWVAAARLAQQRQFVAVGVVIGLSAGWELWGMLGAPVILLAARPHLLKAAGGGLVTLAVLYLPFVLTGVFHMFEFGWPVRDSTLVHVLWPDLERFPWSLRLAQALIALAVGCAVALLTARTRYAVWIVPAGIVLARLIADPTFYGYYWLAVDVVVLGLAAALTAHGRWIAATAALLTLGGLWSYATKGLAAALVLLVVILVVSIVLAVRRRASGGLVLHDSL